MSGRNAGEARLDRHLELSDALKVAVNAFVTDDALDHIDRRVEALIKALGDVWSQAADHARMVLCIAIIVHATIAA